MSGYRTTSTPAAVGLSAERLERVKAWMEGWVARGDLPGVMVAVVRRGEVAWLHCHGQMDVEAGKPITPDSVFRIYSMTKPMVAVAAMTHYEEGRFQLDDPLAKYLPAFAEMQVAVDDGAGPRLVPAARPISVRDLFTHTSGLIYGRDGAPFVKEFYEAKGVNFQDTQAGISLAEMTDRTAELPLVCHPGSAWNYGISTDVLGRLVEVLSGTPLDRAMAERVTGPLRMTDTAFRVPEEKWDRFAACYARENGKTVLSDPPRGSRFTRPPDLFSGGGGMVGTIGDYDRFCRMLLGRGALDGVRLLGRKTVEYMTSNHLPGDMASMGQPRWSETTYDGIGFGLGFAVMLDPVRAHVVGSPGEHHWGGVASTAFWVDPAEDMFVLLMTQVMPSSALPLRRQLRVLTYQAIVD